MSLDQLANIVEKELVNRKVYQEAHDVIQTIKGLKQNEKETIKAIEVAKKELDSLNAKIAEKVAVAEKADQHASAVLSEANKVSAEKIEEAKKKASAIVSEAENKLASIVNNQKAAQASLDATIAAQKSAEQELKNIKEALEKLKSKFE